MTSIDPTMVERVCVDVISSALAAYRPKLLTAALEGEAQERRNERHRDNFLSAFDLELHDHYRTALSERLPGFVYLSEEAEPESMGTSTDLVILVDPLDTSELAVRGLHGYTHLLAYSRREARPLVAVVGDFYHHIDLYVGTSGQPATLRTRDGAMTPISVPARSPADRLLVTSYNMRPTERFIPIAQQARLMRLLSRGLDQQPAEGPADLGLDTVDASGSRSGDGPAGDRSRIGVDFGSIGLCHVATGATDVFLEFAKGFALWDLLPGQFILERAGGVTCDLAGRPLPWPSAAFADIETMQAAMNTRQTFIAAGSLPIAECIAKTIDG